MIINNPPLPVLGRNDVLSLSKDNERMYRDSKKTDMLFYAAFLKKIDELLNVNNKKYDTMFNASIRKNIRAAITEKKETTYEKFSLAGIMRRAINPQSGGILDAVVTGLEQKREQRRKERQERKDFESAYMRTDAGRKLNIRPDAFRKSEIEKEYELFKKLRKAEEAKKKEISDQEEQANKFGLGMPTKKSYNELEKIQKALQMNIDRVIGKKSNNSQQVKLNDVISTGTEKETANEANDIFKDMLKSLVNIETILSEKIKPETKEIAQPQQSNGGILDFLSGAIGGFLSNGLKALFGTLFNPKNLLKIITKFALPVAIVGSLVNGVIDGFKEWQKTGSIKEAIIAGLGGVLEFISFGLLDKTDIAKSFDYVAEKFNELTTWVADNILDPLINKVINPIKDFYTNTFKIITDFANEKILSGFGIPQLNKFISEGIDEAKVKYDEKNSNKMTPLQKKEYAEKIRNDILQKRNKEQTNQNNVIAPTVVNSSTTKINLSKNVRNSESTINRYINK